MTLTKLTITTLALCHLLCGCSPILHPIIYEHKIKEYPAANLKWEKIAILPFTGNPSFNRVTAEFLNFFLNRRQVTSIIAPAIAEIELERKGQPLTASILGLEDLCVAGRLIGANAVIAGHFSKDFSRYPQIGIQLIDTNNCAEIKTISESCKPLIQARRYHRREVYRKAVFVRTKLIAHELNSILYDTP